MVLLTSLINVAVLVGGVISGILVRQFNQIHPQGIINGLESTMYFSYWWLVDNLAIFIAALALLGYADLIRRRGDSYFQEASNLFQELEVVTDKAGRKEVDFEIASLARMELKSFSSAADMPLVHGRLGAAVYAVVNFIVVTVAVILYTQFA